MNLSFEGKQNGAFETCLAREDKPNMNVLQSKDASYINDEILSVMLIPVNIVSYLLLKF